jgi:hypothetical protein
MNTHDDSKREEGTNNPPVFLAMATPTTLLTANHTTPITLTTDHLKSFCRLLQKSRQRPHSRPRNRNLTVAVVVRNVIPVMMIEKKTNKNK